MHTMLRPVRDSVAVQTQFVHLECAEINTNGLPAVNRPHCKHVTIPHEGVRGLAAVLYGRKRIDDEFAHVVRALSLCVFSKCSQHCLLGKTHFLGEDYERPKIKLYL